VACFYYCVIVLMRHPDDPRPLIAEGVWPGHLVVQARGRHGFGYDPHFLPTGEELTAAEMDSVRKNQVSHRAGAMARLAAALVDEGVNDAAGARIRPSGAPGGPQGGAPMEPL
jgi:XTP/dITP diphosphohydrolase